MMIQKKYHKELKVWGKAHNLTLAVYRATLSFPHHELYSLTRQMRRSSASVPSNIAEGCGRDGETELARFMQIAMGSASELEYQLLLAHDLKLLETSLYERLTSDVAEVKRMLTSLIKKLKADS